MGARIRTLLIILSISLNVAFLTAWGVKTCDKRADAARNNLRSCNQDSCRIWCPLHRALGTTDAQWKVLEPIQQNFQSATQEFTDSADVLRAQLVDLLAEPVLNQAAIDAKQNEICAVQRHMQTLVVNHLLDEKRVLTSAQQAKLFAMMRENGACSGHRGTMGAKHGGKACPMNTVNGSLE
jgi:Spy/CpxP family protein refolding chaperone